MKITDGIKTILNGELIIDSLDVNVDKTVFKTDGAESGFVLFTSTRVIIYVNKWFQEDYSKQIEINSITNITHKKGWLSTKIIFSTNDDEIKIESFDNDNAKQFVESLVT